MEIETQKMMTIALEHITDSDNEILQKYSGPGNYGKRFTCGEDIYGFFLYAGSPQDLEDNIFAKEAKEIGMSASFVEIMRTAVSNGCTHVRFDVDGPNYDGLPTYTWDWTKHESSRT